MAAGLMGVVLGRDLDVALQLRWAQCLAEARSLDLLVYEYVSGHGDGTSEVPLEEPLEGDEGRAAREVQQLVRASSRLHAGPRPEEAAETAEGEERPIYVRFKQIRSSKPHFVAKGLVADVTKEKLDLITTARGELDTRDPDLARERRQFLRLVPCEVVFCLGLTEDNTLSRIVAGAASGPHGSAAVRLGHDLAARAGTTLTAVRVNPSIGPDSEGVGHRRLDSLLKKALGKEAEGVRRRVVVDDQIHQGLRRVWDQEAHDLVVLGAARIGGLGSQVGRGVGSRLSKGEAGPAVVIVSAGSPIRNRLLGAVEGLVGRVVPQIDRESRVALVDRIQSSSHWDFDFVALMVLSTLIASIGLIQSSAAVVIGAMLVAPLMTPLLGLGLALVQGNPVLARTSFRSISFGLLVSLLVALLVGLLTPGFSEPTREMLSRGGPSLLDLFVAFASGLAAAYAYSRPGLLAALPGVAIAAALVPPIATSGLALSLGNIDLAWHALLLFVINTVTIVLASMTSLWAVGLRNIKRTSRWALIGGNAVLVSVLMLGVFLSVRPDPKPRPKEIPADLIQDVQEQLGTGYRLESVGVAYDEIGVQLNVRVLGSGLVPEELADEIRLAVRRHFNKPVRVRMATEVAADDEPR